MLSNDCFESVLVSLNGCFAWLNPCFVPCLSFVVSVAAIFADGILSDVETQEIKADMPLVRVERVRGACFKRKPECVKDFETLISIN